MKIKYVGDGANLDNEVTNAVKIVFDTIAKSRYACHFPRTVKVSIITKRTASPARVCCDPFGGPSFEFSIVGLSIMDLTACIEGIAFDLGSTPRTFYNTCMFVVAHEIAHWINFCILARRKKFAHNPHVANIMCKIKNGKKYHLENIINKRNEVQMQMAYRKIYTERSADRLAKIIVEHIVLSKHNSLLRREQRCKRSTNKLQKILQLLNGYSLD
jgi:hypothetical protein